MALFEPIFSALSDNHVRYVVVGGLATVLHGFARLTADIDMIVDLDPPEARRAVRTRKFNAEKEAANDGYER